MLLYDVWKLTMILFDFEYSSLSLTAAEATNGNVRQHET
jgi:hypothetical protein